MAGDKIVFWSLESSKKVEEIKDYLMVKWSPKAASDFLDNLARFEAVVTKFPHLYPRSISQPRLRKAVLSKHTSVVYEIDGNFIRVHTVLNNLQDNA